VVAKRGEDSVSLACLTTTTGPVTWKLNNDDPDFEDHMSQNGHNLIVRDVDAPLLGEYSCWRDGTKLSSTYLLQETEEGEDLGLPTCHWVSSSGQPNSQELQFELTHTLSPFGEESTMLEVTAEAISIDDFFLLRRTKLFYLRDIVVPDSPRIVSFKVVQSKLKVSIEPPSSWSTPHSFFSLEHEIEYVLRDNGKTMSSLSSLIPKKISMFRARSRDPLVSSPWSQWTRGGIHANVKRNRYLSCHPSVWNAARRKWRKEELNMLNKVNIF
ncbi:hypothetical protein CCH79_00009070, partial [Gambusia affinis]